MAARALTGWILTLCCMEDVDPPSVSLRVWFLLADRLWSSGVAAFKSVSGERLYAADCVPQPVQACCLGAQRAVEPVRGGRALPQRGRLRVHRRHARAARQRRGRAGPRRGLAALSRHPNPAPPGERRRVCSAAALGGACGVGRKPGLGVGRGVPRVRRRRRRRRRLCAVQRGVPAQLPAAPLRLLRQPGQPGARPAPPCSVRSSAAPPPAACAVAHTGPAACR